MSQSRYMNTRFSGRQDAYLTKIQDTAKHLLAGEMETICPRDGCERPIQARDDGLALILTCPECGVIFRGNKSRLLRVA